MLEIKVTLTADQTLVNLLKALANPIFIEKIEAPKKEYTEVNNVEEKRIQPAETEKVEPEKNTVDYTSIRNDIKRIGVEKKAAGKDTKAVMLKYGGVLSKMPNDDNLVKLLAELEAL